MQAELIDGKSIAKSLCGAIAERVSKLKEKGVTPRLAVILVGGSAASALYVKNKIKKGEELGIVVDINRFNDDVQEEALLQRIKALNENPEVHGIIVQMPLPAQINADRVLLSVSPNKDVDGTHPENLGAIASGTEAFQACTPKGILRLLQCSEIPVQGKNAVVVGRSCLVGIPVAMLLLRQNATVTICHSKTQDLGAITRQADILVCATGRIGLLTREMVKPGAVVIDVGTIRKEDRWYGDVDFDGVSEVASQITPVPGGVGPMTVTMLMENTLIAAERTMQK